MEGKTMLELNQNVHGFTVTRIRELEDCGGTLYEMMHEQTGAELCWLKREEANKTFGIAFKTIPFDDTGVFHILEHSVLSGSEKYPLREPFVNLLKSSMQTFLNAITFPDKTVYPFSSRNDKDFMNLLSVYMDAVFAPLLYKNPNIFRQEGWHYEIRNEADAPIFKGVVLNEMKGAYSSVDETVVSEMGKRLFPDNCYRFNSGGDPKAITDLTYEQYCDTHAKFYHPSNSRVFVDGNVDIDAVLAFVNDAYFSKYEKEEFDFSIPMQKVQEGSSYSYEYEIAPDEDPAHKAIAAFAKIICTFKETEKITAWQTLASVLAGNNESPLKKVILDAGLGEDVELDLMDGIQQPWVLLMVRNTDPEKYDKIVGAFRKTAEELVNGKLNHDEILASLDQMEFKYREKYEPSGLIFAQKSLDAWLYEGDPAQFLNCSGVFDSLRKKTEEGYFEELLKEFLLEGEPVSVTAVPSNTLQERRQKEEEKKLADAKASWKDIGKYIRENAELDQWQSEGDTPEALAKLPVLSLSDVDPKPIPFEWEETSISGVPALVYPKSDTGISYMNFYFSLAGITKDKLPALSFFVSLLGHLPTENKSVLELQTDMKRILGSFSAAMEAYSDNNKSCKPTLGLSISMLEKNREKAVDLILEVIQKTIFDPALIRPLLKQQKEDFRQSLIMAGHSAAVRRANAHQSSDGVFREMTAGYEAGMWVNRLDEAYDEKIDEFLNDCELFSEILFSPARLTVSYSDPDNRCLAEKFISALNNVDAERCTVHYPLLEGQKEMIEIPAGIAYSGWAGSFAKDGIGYNGNMSVMSHILTFDYLWNEVRVKGGSYGTGYSVSLAGNYSAYSFRDPDPFNTMEVYGKTADYLKGFLASGEDISQYIIGTIAAAEPVISPGAKIRVADARYFRGITYERRCQNRSEILNAKAEDLKAYLDVIGKGKEEAYCVIIGSKDVIEKGKEQGFTVLEQI